MKPILYSAGEVAFTSNGLGRLHDIISCEVTEELNTGVYECNFTYPVTGALYDQIQLGCIVAVTHDDTGDVQPFDIVGYTRPIDGIVSYHAVHISYRLSHYIAVPGPDIRYNNLADIFLMFHNAFPHDIAGRFDYEGSAGLGTAYMAATADGLPRSVRQYIGMEGGVLDTFACEVNWNRFLVKFVKRRGQYRNFAIRYGVNLADYNEEANGEETYTSAIAYWSKDGKLVTAEVNSGLPYYDHVGSVAMDLTNRFEAEPTEAELTAAATELMVNGQVNLPSRSIEVDFVHLKDFEEYKDYAALLTVELGDSISVIFPAYNMAGTYRVVKTVWDPLLGKFKSLTLGTLRTTLAQALGTSGGGTTSVGGGGGGVIHYGECPTAAGTAAKTVSISSFTAADLVAGATVLVKFTNANGVANPTLNVSGTGAKPIRRHGTTAAGASADTSWNTGAIVCLIYDGTAWYIEGWINTTYSSMTDAQYQAGTSTSAMLISPARLKAAIAYYAILLADRYTRSSAGDLNWTSTTEGDSKAIMKSALAFWTGAYSGTSSNLRYSSAGQIIGRNQICYANSRVDTFSNGEISIPFANLGITTGARPVGILLTPEYSSDIVMHYMYDNSGSNVVIRAWKAGTAYSGALRYFAVVFQNTWTSV